MGILATAVLMAVLALVGCAAAGTSDHSGGGGSQATNTASESHDAGEGYYADKVATPTEEATGEGLGVGQIPHLVNEDYPDCLSCHNDDNYMVVMEDHASYTEDMCLSCHQPMDKEVKEYDARPRSEREAEAAATAESTNG